MVDLLGKLHAFIKPLKGDVLLDTDWLDDLPRHDYLAAQDVVLGWLREFASDENALDRRALQALFVVEQKCRENIETLTRQYVNAPTLPFEIDERIWQSVYNYYHVLDRAYQAFLDKYAGNLAQAPILEGLPQLILNQFDSQRSAAKWRYLRYQSMTEGGWLRMHRLYQLAEFLGCTRTTLKRFPDQPDTTLMSCYLQALMLDTLNHTSMLKTEIEMLASWLEKWCGGVMLDTEYLEARHLFFVNLEEDRGGRRIRHFQPSSSDRYWDTDKVVLQVERLSQYLRQSRMPEGLHLAPDLRFSDGQLLTEHMLIEWSRAAYRRQRRGDERDEVTKDAQVINGIINVCQHVKNVTYSRGRQFHHEELNIHPVPPAGDEPPRIPADEIVLSVTNAEKWTIQNESRYGFGALVNAGMNLWLRPGKLIALDYEWNPDIPVVGVIRSVKQRSGNKRQVGIEVLSHTPAYIRLKNLTQSSESKGFLSQEAFVAATLTVHGAIPFAGLYLPRDEEQDIAASLILPRLEFIAGGLFELRTDSYHCQVRLGRVIEQKDDWVRVEVQLSDETALSA